MSVKRAWDHDSVTDWPNVHCNLRTDLFSGHGRIYGRPGLQTSTQPKRLFPGHQAYDDYTDIEMDDFIRTYRTIASSNLNVIAAIYHTQTFSDSENQDQLIVQLGLGFIEEG